MHKNLDFTIFSSTKEFPENWNNLAVNNIFLTKEYLTVLELSPPKNMICNYIGVFKNNKLVGIALSQFLDLNKLESFGERDKCIKAAVRKFIFKNYSSHVLFIGNNMLSGQNAYCFSNEIEFDDFFTALKLASEKLALDFKNQGKKIHLLNFKDFNSDDSEKFNINLLKEHYQFNTQPNMVFEIPEEWNSEADYINVLHKKYRDQYKRARKKCVGIVKRKLNLQEIKDNQETIYDLYFHVAKNAPFNTFFLAKNHFSVFKEQLKDNFLFYGYFENDKLIGFNTLIKNGRAMDTYFLGYDDTIQREKMLYLNMLYDMICYSIKKGYKEIVFARTALEIKSSVGAKPINMYGFMKHTNKLIDKNISKIFKYLEPKVEWNQRNPYKN